MKKNFSKAKRILIKIGTAVITKNNRLNKELMRQKAREISELIHGGKQVIMISSGAVGAGMEISNVTDRPRDVIQLQLLSGKGQPRLMRLYELKFKKFGIQIAQILLTHHNFQTQNEVNNLSDVIKGYFKTHTLPIVNTNDIITKEELTNGSSVKFTDNDELAALVAKTMKVDLLLILTNIDGLYMNYASKVEKPTLLENVDKITKNILDDSRIGISPLGLGGMYSKVKAAQYLLRHNIPTIIANGKHSIPDILENKVKRTLINTGQK
ncbi:glutamate 5-kinase [bacterium]|nr:glutamate 5-kinase [bacterium]